MVSHDASTLKEHCESGGLLENGHLRFFDTIDETISAYDGALAA
jgi:ABC-type polysaccharide/polyol phosphate transport system ATPase subunit